MRGRASPPNPPSQAAARERGGGRDVGVVRARIDAGRWVADCPRCQGAELVSRTRPVFVCGSCGLGPLPVLLPADVAAVEATLAGRRVRECYWRPDEWDGSGQKRTGSDKIGRINGHGE